MKHILILMTALSLSGAVWAQETDGQSGDADVANETAESPTLEESLDLGEPAGDENVLGRPYVREVSGDWEIRCVRTGNPDEDPCQLYQLLRDRGDNPVAEISIFRLPEGGQAAAGANVIVPLETLLTAKMTISVDGTQGKRYDYSFCNTVGCFARIGLTPDDVNSFKRGATAAIQLRPFAAPDQIVTALMSLTGFTAGFDKIPEVEDPS